MENIGKNASLLTLSRALVMIIQIFNAMILSRYRTLEEFGTFSQLSMSVSLATTIIIMGLPSSINYFLVKNESFEDRKLFLSNYYTLSSLLGIFTGIILLFGSPILVKYFNNISINSYGFYLMLMPLISVIGSSLGNVLIVYNRIKFLTLYNFFSNLLLFLVILSSIYLDLSFKEYLSVFVFIQVLLTILIYIVVYRITSGFNILLQKSMIIKILKFSIPLGLATVMGTLHIQLDKLIIGYYFDTKTMAIYTNAARELPITLIASSLTAVLMPKLVKLTNNNLIKEAVELWGKTILISYIFICFFASVLVIFAPELITLMYSEKYLPGIQIFRVYSIVSLLGLTYFGTILNAIGKTKLILYSSILSLLFNVILNFIFYNLFGLIGPALATLVASSLVALFQLYATSIYTKIRLSLIFPWKGLIKISVTNFVIGLFFFFIKLFVISKLEFNSITKLILFGVLWSFVYCLGMIKYLRVLWKAIS